MSDFQPFQGQSNHSTSFNGGFVSMAAGSGMGQHGNILNAQFQEVVDR